MLLNGKTPYEILFGKQPNYEYSKPLGASVTHVLFRATRTNLAIGVAGVFLWESVGQKGWFVYDLGAGEYFLSRDVVFSKKEFPYVVSHISPLTVMHISQVRR